MMMGTRPNRSSARTNWANPWPSISGMFRSVRMTSKASEASSIWRRRTRASPAP